MILLFFLKNRRPIHDNWSTPDELYDKLNKEFKFTFDPCPLHSNENTLIRDWGKRNFINPPYTTYLKEEFVKKALQQAMKGKLCVLLLSVATSTKLFKEYIFPYADEIRLISKRVKYKGINTKGEFVDNKAGQQDSMIVIFKPKKKWKKKKVNKIILYDYQ